MILTVFSGGIGNQLFQYTAALVLSNNKAKKIIFDTAFYERKLSPEITLREFKLDRFGLVSGKVVGKYQSRLLRKFYKLRSSFLKNIVSNWRYEEIQELELFRNDARLTHKEHCVFLNGYWQCKDYAEKSAPYLKNTLFKTCRSDGERQAIFDGLKGITKVAIHVRRGDYSNELLVCGKQYYLDSIEKMKQVVCNNETIWLIFSDDIDWVKKNIQPLGNVLYVSTYGRTDIDDFTAMSYCDHHIISNSTFSWWAAFIASNSSAETVVIAPELWWRALPVRDISIYPAGWQVMKV